MAVREGNKNIWTIGHSNRPVEKFLEMLRSFEIKVLVDVRSYPGSKHCPQYNKEILIKTLAEKGIEYLHMPALGGRRRANPDSKNVAWHNPAFRGYADYMETDAFKKGIEELEKIGGKNLTAYMCSEAVWWSCHRSLISDYLKIREWKVWHIMEVGKATEHPYTKAAHIENGTLSYNGTLFENKEDV
jgi:uncharacterized protein (DUF488 family)